MLKEYQGFATLAMLLLVFGLSVLAGRIILPILRAKKVGQVINTDGPAWHAGKSGTPTMGGISFILAFLVGLAAVTVYAFVSKETFDYIPFALVVCYGVLNAAIGFVDDYFKLINKRNLGLTEKQKMLLQLVASAAFIAMMAITGNLSTAIRIPYFNVTWELSWFAYPIYLLVLVGFVNSTNLTDGLDGLASSVCAVVTIFMTLVALRLGNTEMGLISVALLGGVLGFLIYNFHPAKMFMGDTGSLFLGAVIMGCAMMVGELVVFVLAGFVFVLDMLSSLLQRVYYKLSHGKRIFKMAPVHHHFEKCGWSEVAIVGLFSGVSVLFCVLAWLGI